MTREQDPTGSVSVIELYRHTRLAEMQTRQYWSSRVVSFDPLEGRRGSISVALMQPAESGIGGVAKSPSDCDRRSRSP